MADLDDSLAQGGTRGLRRSTAGREIRAGRTRQSGGTLGQAHVRPVHGQPVGRGPLFTPANMFLVLLQIYLFNWECTPTLMSGFRPGRAVHYANRGAAGRGRAKIWNFLVFFLCATKFEKCRTSDGDGDPDRLSGGALYRSACSPLERRTCARG